MKYCTFTILQQREDHRGISYQVQCTTCGIRRWIRDQNMQFKCRNSPVNKATKEPTMIEKAANYVASTAKHIANGMELRTQEEIDAIYEICKGCEFFKAKKGGFKCGKCGCSLNTNASHVNNKLARRSDSCPDGRWGAGTDNP